MKTNKGHYFQNHKSESNRTDDTITICHPPGTQKSQLHLDCFKTLFSDRLTVVMSMWEFPTDADA